ncbi:MAG TPA: hypothetical protein VFE53_04140 [Mucilaginibacter sp.]|jgi:uncharacterized membrane protein|nr:hypothetical protein [Mucilaginibacter sp.]
METQTLYHLALVTHIVALTMIAGTTLVDYVIFKQFWKQLAIDGRNGVVINEATSKFPLLFGVGFLLIIVSGVYMMYVTNGAFGEQIWFRIKFALVIIILINGVVVGRRQGLKLRKLLAGELPGKKIGDELAKVRRNLNVFHNSQLLLLLAIFTLSVFKFN